MSSEKSTAADLHTEFDEFLKTAISDYYKLSGKKRKGNFIALLIASGELGSMAVDQVRSGSGIKKVALGAAGVLALRLGLRYALSGPLGIVLAGVTAASLIAYFARNRQEIVGQIGSHRQLIAEIRQSFDQLQSDFRDGRFTEDQRNLMVEGLLKRFLAEIDAR
jgi:hypothetical protein